MEHFKLSEFTKSSTAEKYKINNTPNGEEIRNIEQLVDNILDPLRNAFGMPISVTSGYRCKELNVKVGGSKTSDHMKGCAADILTYQRDKYGKCVRDKSGNVIVDKEGNKRIFELIRKLHLPFKQLIDESNFSWVHVSYDPDADNPRRQILKM